MTEPVTTDDDLRRLLLEPPQVLQDMRWIYNGYPPETPAQQKLQKLWDGTKDDQRRFLAEMRAVEKDYRGGAQKGGQAADAPAPLGEPPLEPVEVLIEELIGRAAADPRDEEVAALKAEVARRDERVTAPPEQEKAMNRAEPRPTLPEGPEGPAQKS